MLTDLDILMAFAWFLSHKTYLVAEESCLNSYQRMEFKKKKKGKWHSFHTEGIT